MEDIKEMECPKCMQKGLPRRFKLDDDRVVLKCTACGEVLQW